jgi:hypothetical protein
VPVVEANKSEILTGSLFFNENFSPKIEKKRSERKNYTAGGRPYHLPCLSKKMC